MKDKTIKWLSDIKTSAEIIFSATKDKDYADYNNDVILRAAVERHFEIIGESVNRIARHDPETAGKISDYSKIISFRNILIHGYDLVNDDDVWSVVQESLPVLYRQVTGLLEND